MRRRIEAALVRSAVTAAEKIHVEVDGDKVILIGEVRSYAEKQDAERAAWSAPGVRSVDNRLLIVV
jgi:osmotically-inducible protein OsmY